MKNIQLFALTVLIFGAIAFLSVVVKAETTQSQFKTVDADHSGTLTKSEYTALKSDGGTFSSLDANGDSSLSIDELNTNTADVDSSSNGGITGDVSVGTPNNGTAGSSGTAGMSNSGSAGSTTAQ